MQTSLSILPHTLRQVPQGHVDCKMMPSFVSIFKQKMRFITIICIYIFLILSEQF